MSASPLHRRKPDVLPRATKERTMKGLEGKVAVITGSAGGIGRATAKRLASHGVHVVVADLDRSGAEETVSQLDTEGLAVEFDATDATSTQRIASEAIERFDKIDILHNNVGVTASAWDTDSTLLDTELDWWDLTWQVNLRSFVVLSKVVVEHMLDRGSGSIINMSSMEIGRASCRERV